MDDRILIVIVMGIFALLAVVSFLLYRQRGRVKIKGPLGTGIELDGSNEPEKRAPGIELRNVTSQQGRIIADDNTGQGILADGLNTKDDVVLTTDLSLQESAAMPPQANQTAARQNVHAENIASGRDTFVIGQLVAPIQSPEKGSSRKIDSKLIKIERILPLVDENEQFVGYEATVINENGCDAWLDGARIRIKLIQRAPCMGDLDLVCKYSVRLTTKGITESSTKDGASFRQNIGGTITDTDDARYRVNGNLVFTDDCQSKTWLLEMAFPLTVWLPAQGHARVQLLFSVDEALLTEQKSSGGWVARTLLGSHEEEELLFEIHKSGNVSKAFSGEMAPLLINRIVGLVSESEG